MEDRFKPSNNSSSSSSSSKAARNVAPAPVDSISMSTREYPQFATQGGNEFKRTMPAQEHAPGIRTTSVTSGTVMGEGGSTVISEVGVISGMENKRRKGDFSSRLTLPQVFPNTRDSGGNNIMSGIAMEMEPGIQGLGHNSAESSATTGETFQGMLGSRDESSLQQTDQPLGIRFPTSESESSFIGRSLSLSHPNLSSRPALLTSAAATTTPAGPTHSQAPIPFPNISSFALSSMMGHFTSHPHLQSQPLSMNPSAAGGLMQGLGISVGSNQTVQPSSISSSLAQTLSLPNSAMSGLLGSMQNTSSISIMNTPGSLGAGTGGSRSSLPIPQSTAIPMPLTHPNLQNPAGLPLIPGMPNMYSYPYAATIPTQPPTTSVAHAGGAPPAGFPSQSLVPNYSQYLPPSLYRNPAQQQQPPVSAANFSR